MLTISGMPIHMTLVVGLVVLQSTVFRHGVILGVTPDLALLVLVFSANQHGSYKGQIVGFAGGIVQDLLSFAPLGLNAFLRTLTGFLYGSFRGKLFVDPIFVPILMAAAATVLKAVLSFVLFGIFAPEYVAVAFSTGFAVELGLNCVLSPFVYGLLRATGFVRASRERTKDFD